MFLCIKISSFSKLFKFVCNILIIIIFYQNFNLQGVVAFPTPRIKNVLNLQAYKSIIKVSTKIYNNDINIKEFEDCWINKYNIYVKNLKHIYFSKDIIRGLASLYFIKSNSIIVSIPSEYCLSVSSSSLVKSKISSVECLQMLEKCDDMTFKLAILLMCEMSKYGNNNNNNDNNNNESDTKVSFIMNKYFNILPNITEFNSFPFNWDNNKLSSFPYKPLVRSVRKQKQKWTESYSLISSSGIISPEMSLFYSFEVYL